MMSIRDSKASVLAAVLVLMLVGPSVAVTRGGGDESSEESSGKAVPFDKAFATWQTKVTAAMKTITAAANECGEAGGALDAGIGGDSASSSSSGSGKSASKGKSASASTSGKESSGSDGPSLKDCVPTLARQLMDMHDSTKDSMRRVYEVAEGEEAPDDKVIEKAATSAGNILQLVMKAASAVRRLGMRDGTMAMDAYTRATELIKHAVEHDSPNEAMNDRHRATFAAQMQIVVHAVTRMVELSDKPGLAAQWARSRTEARERREAEKERQRQLRKLQRQAPEQLVPVAEVVLVNQ